MKIFFNSILTSHFYMVEYKKRRNQYKKPKASLQTK
nr:MAG TPA: hypothetical protein [Caudoviricetes sp.]